METICKSLQMRRLNLSIGKTSTKTLLSRLFLFTLSSNKGIFIRHPNVYQLLGIQANRADKLREFLALGTKNFHDAETRHDAVAGLFKIAENNMAGLLAAKA